MDTRVVILGAGFGGLQTAFALRKALPSVPISVVSRSNRFCYRPDSIYVPFGLDPGVLETEVEDPLRKRNIELVVGDPQGVDLDGHWVEVRGRRLHYTHLVVATGSQSLAERIPGLITHGFDITSVARLLGLQRAFAGLLADALAGQSRQVLFLLPPETYFTGPIYEVALMLDTWLDRQGYRDGIDIRVATWEDHCLQALTSTAHSRLLELLQGHHVGLVPGWKVDRVEEGRVHDDSNRSLPYDILVTSPPLTGAIRIGGLAYDSNGFVLTDPGSRHAEGADDVYVVGDAAADQSVKQAYMAFAQADIAVHHIVASVRGEVPTRFYHPTTRYVLDTMDSGLLIDAPVGGAGDFFRARGRSSKLWHLSKRLLGQYLPWRVRQGEPFTDLLDGVPRSLAQFLTM